MNKKQLRAVPWNNNPHWLRTDKAAQFCKVPNATLRSWSRLGLITPARRANNGGEADWNYYRVKDLRHIRQLRDKYGTHWTCYVH